MKIVQITRFAYSPNGTFGHLTLPSGKILATVERPWIDNEKNISCIPVGGYKCEPSFYYRGNYEAFEVMGVQDRSRILFHIGNFVRNSNGCILVNSKHGAINHEWCGINSRNAFNVFMKEMNGAKFHLNIINQQGGKL